MKIVLMFLILFDTSIIGYGHLLPRRIPQIIIGLRVPKGPTPTSIILFVLPARRINLIIRRNGIIMLIIAGFSAFMSYAIVQDDLRSGTSLASVISAVALKLISTW